MEDLQKKKLNMKVQWTKFIIVMVLYLLFLYWINGWWGLKSAGHARLDEVNSESCRRLSSGI